MDRKQEITANNEINLYDYWRILVKRKKIFFGIFFVPLIITILVSLVIPRYYRGECEISLSALPVTDKNPAITASSILKLVGSLDDGKKVKIFGNNSDLIKSAMISVPPKSTDKLTIIINAKTADVVPRASKNMFDYINSLPEIRSEFDKINAENDFIIQKLTEAKKANLIFLNQVTDMIKKRQLSFVNIINPADLIKKDAELSLEIMNLQQLKTDMLKKKELNTIIGTLGTPSLTRQPSREEIKKVIILTGFLTFFIGLITVFFLEYISIKK